MSSLARVSTVCVVAVALTGMAFAQAPGQVKKEMRAPNQVVETGKQDDVVVMLAGQQVHIDPQTGQMRQPTPQEAAALAASLEQQFGKNVDGITITYLPNGAVAAKLDDSFMEAITVTREADGTLEFGHATGLDKASQEVKAESSEKNETSEKNDASGKNEATEIKPVKDSNGLETE